MKNARQITPEKAAELVRNGALLVDIREAEERESGFIPAAHHAPLSALQPGSVPSKDQPVIFHCRTGKRTAMKAEELCASTTAAEVYILDGGFDGWASLGLPTAKKEA